MHNPYKEGDAVLIQRKGVELEATVKQTWNHEVQVRVVIDRELLWRSVKTIKPVPEPALAPVVEDGETLLAEALKAIEFDEPAGAEIPEPIEEEPAETPVVADSLPEVVGEVTPVAAEAPPAETPVPAVPEGKKRRRGVLRKFFRDDFDQ